jgi:hypothetical protein
MAAAGRVPNYLLRTRGREVYLWNQKVGVVLLAKSRTPRCCNDLGIARRIFPADGCLDRRWRRRSGAPKFTRRCLRDMQEQMKEFETRMRSRGGLCSSESSPELLGFRGGSSSILSSLDAPGLQSLRGNGEGYERHEVTRL